MEYKMTTKYKAEVKPWQPNVEREPEFNSFANPRYLWLENPPPWSETEDGDSAQGAGDAVDTEGSRDEV
jgi:hypothetical protein